MGLSGTGFSEDEIAAISFSATGLTTEADAPIPAIYPLFFCKSHISLQLNLTGGHAYITVDF